MHALTQNSYPTCFERFFSRRLPVCAGALILGTLFGVGLTLSGIVAAQPIEKEAVVLLALVVSITLTPILAKTVRDKTVKSFADLAKIVDESKRDELSKLLKTAFCDRRSLAFSLLIGAGGIVHHVILSYVRWGRIWWYSTVDIILVGFVWWFAVANFFWICVGVATCSFRTSKLCQFSPILFTPNRMCGLGSFGTLSLIPSVSWAIVATFGTVSTFDRAISTEFPQLFMAYLVFDFVVVASSMTAIFFLPVLGFRTIVIPFKHSRLESVYELLGRINDMQLIGDEIAKSDHALRSIYLWVLSSRIQEIKEWPLSLGDSIRFLLSYVIPGSVFIVRIVLFSLRIPTPL